MPWIIDAHQDLAWNALTFGRDYLRSAEETRRLEAETEIPARVGGQTLLGWPDYQRGKIAAIIATVYAAPTRYREGDWDFVSFADKLEAYSLFQAQLEYYRRITGENPEKFRLIANSSELEGLYKTHTETASDGKNKASPIGLILSIEGIEGLGDFRELEEWWQSGVRLIGPVWAGTRFCGGMYEPGGFTREGRSLLETMEAIGYVLDISHMNDTSSMQALDLYSGSIIASHSNARRLLPDAVNERHLSDTVIRKLVERDGVIGVIPFSKFLRPGWKRGDKRETVTLEHLADHIDVICQIAGDARHAGLGTDFDGGFGWPAVPLEIDTIADLQKLGPVLVGRGYSVEDVGYIFGGNWYNKLSKSLPGPT